MTTDSMSTSGQISEAGRIEEAAIDRAKESLGDVRRASREFVRHGADAVRESAQHAEHLARARAGDVEEAVHQGIRRAEDSANRLVQRTADYVQEQPLKALMIATATGALIAIAAGLVSRR
ncbi:MAG: hypothetical protein KDH17_17120 [Rhodocyclaceae bacterium]|nr:hypothetical protein [Rhodocyclaceae bacterium]